MERFDFVIIGAGAGGEAAAHLARERGASVAVVDHGLVGGSCAYWACIPSKSLLHSAQVHATGGDYPWERASDRRDYMINRQGRDHPDDRAHARALEAAGATLIRGTARLVGRGRVEVDGKAPGGRRILEAGNVIVAVGSHSKIPPVEGLDEIDYWTNVEATSARVLPRSLAIMGGGPTGVELAQVYGRYGVPTVIFDSNPRLLARDHPRNSDAVAHALRRDGVDVRLGVRARRVERAAGRDGAHRITLSDGSLVEGHAVLVAVGRSSPLAGLGLETVGVEVDGADRLYPDEYLRIAENVYAVGDPAGPELHTHLAHFEGEAVVRIALGDARKPDFRAIPRAVYTDPETGSVGLQVEEAQRAGHDAFEETADLGTSAKGYVAEASGHVTIVVDRRERILLGAFIAVPGASEAIHEAVMAVKARKPLAVLADTMHAFPTAARVMGGLFTKAHRQLEEGTSPEATTASFT